MVRTPGCVVALRETLQHQHLLCVLQAQLSHCDRKQQQHDRGK